MEMDGGMKGPFRKSNQTWWTKMKNLKLKEPK